MNPNKKRKCMIFIIKDETGSVWGVAPSMVQARRQIAWFLPRGNKFVVEVVVADTA
jgi:hypothetical protein